MRERLIEILMKTVIEDEYGYKLLAVGIWPPRVFEALSDQLISEGVIAPPKKTSQEELWEKNAEQLRCGGFGSIYGEECYGTMLRYWQAQEQAGYPHASENVKCFEFMIAEREGKV